ncbi:nucleotide exchange factor GrpE [Solwaraspora sp. WMMB335]|uniref:nucleotide exchange factor GrpE n=1 Tax=Solwaraspora sp. WMMB335 TaxID=3404118 RepID=UPI003B93B9C2
MTDKPRAADPAVAGSAPGGKAAGGPADGQATERLVIRDKRRIDPTGTRTRSARHAAADPADAQASTDQRTAAGRHARRAPEEEPVSPQANGSQSDQVAASTTPATQAEPAATEPASAEPAATEPAVEPETSDAAVVDEPVTGEVVEPAEVLDGQPSAEPQATARGAAAGDTGAGALGAELEALRADLDERTRDLQRVTAEYANYRKRVDRDRGLVSEQATGAVLAALLPILDDLDRAREHGDLVGPFGTVAEQLNTALGKFGLTPFGEKGDPFDPTRHEAVAHQTSAEVTEPTCVDVMRRGYLLGDRLLRPALVAVADPE